MTNLIAVTLATLLLSATSIHAQFGLPPPILVPVPHAPPPILVPVPHGPFGAPPFMFPPPPFYGGGGFDGGFGGGGRQFGFGDALTLGVSGALLGSGSTGGAALGTLGLASVFF